MGTLSRNDDKSPTSIRVPESSLHKGDELWQNVLMMENEVTKRSEAAIPATNIAENRHIPVIGHTSVDPDSSQQSKKMKLSHASDTAIAMTGGPILRLRGGGADAKRKEARKRKFGQSQLQEPSIKSPEQQSGGESAEIADKSTLEQPPEKKKKKHNTQLAVKTDDDGRAESEVVEADAGKGAENTDGGEAADAETAAGKPQRFIVFIGTHSRPSSLLAPSHTPSRQPPLHSNNRIHNHALLQSATHLRPPPHAQRNGQIERFCVPGIQRLRSDEDLFEVVSSFEF